MSAHVLVFFALLGLTASSSLDVPFEKAQCDCGSLVGKLQVGVETLASFVEGVVKDVIAFRSCGIFATVRGFKYLLSTTIRVIARITQSKLPEVPAAKEPDTTCSALHNTIANFKKLVADLEGDAAASEDCGCKVPSFDGGVLAELIALFRVMFGWNVATLQEDRLNM
uniref:Secreted protein n=1 Tax=Steinernema glaseri TaxID=37863 RepID=A0A1I7Z421_9BILA